MKAKNKLIIIALLGCVCLLFMAGCSILTDVEGIELKGYSEQTPIEIFEGDFPYSEHTVIVRRSGGRKQEIALTEDMISEADRLKFYQEGRHEVSVTYGDASTAVTVVVSRRDFSDDVRLDDSVRRYTGQEFTVEVEGRVPGGTKITYPQGNTFKNAGFYDMTAVLQCEGYKSKVLSARITVEKANYDMTCAQLYDETFVYNGDTRSLKIMGERTVDEKGAVKYAPAQLPSGVSVSYSIVKIKNGDGTEIPEDRRQVSEGNQATEAGTYEVCASFKGDAANYNEIASSVAYLEITRAEYDMSSAVLEDKRAEYTGFIVSLSITDDFMLPSSVGVSYTITRIRDADGTDIPEEERVTEQGNGAVNAGIYVVKAYFSVSGKNANNYKATPAEKSAYLTITRSDFSSMMNKVHLDYQSYVFSEGEEYSVILDGNLPVGVTPEFKVTNSKGEVVEGEIRTVEVVRPDGTKGINYVYVFTAAEADTYTCVVSFSHTFENYKQIEDMQTRIFIVPPAEEEE